MTTTYTLTGDLRTILGDGVTAVSASIGTNLGTNAPPSEGDGAFRRFRRRAARRGLPRRPCP